ncbi:hypothetical protein ACJ73_09150, partial [Blastomyces percursus]
MPALPHLQRFGWPALILNGNSRLSANPPVLFALITIPSRNRINLHLLISHQLIGLLYKYHQNGGIFTRRSIKNHPLTNLVDRLRGALQDAEKLYESRLIYDGADESLDQLYRNAISKLLSTLQGEDAAYSLRSRMSDGDVASDLAQLFERLRKAKGPSAVFTLIDTIPRRITPPASVPPSFDGTPVKSTSSSQKGSEQTRELVNPRIFEEIRGCTFRGVEGFFVKFFEGKDWSDKADAICRRVLGPDSDGDWSQFPDPPTQDDVLAWWFRLQEDLLSESPGTYYTTASKADLTGSKAERQVDLLLRARGASPSQNNHDWRDILVVGELKKSKDEIKTKGTLLQMSRYVREVFAAQPTRRF